MAKRGSYDLRVLTWCFNFRFFHVCLSLVVLNGNFSKCRGKSEKRIDLKLANKGLLPFLVVLFFCCKIVLLFSSFVWSIKAELFRRGSWSGSRSRSGSNSPRGEVEGRLHIGDIDETITVADLENAFRYSIFINSYYHHLTMRKSNAVAVFKFNSHC